MATDFDFGFSYPSWGANEKDLSSPATISPGLTPVVIVGEFPQGPAFSGVNHRSATAFTNAMGLRTNERLGGAPRYMASFHAQSVLEESDDLTTVRVLGLSGYNAGPSWVITADNGMVVAVLRARGLYVTPTDSAPTYAATTVTATDLNYNLLNTSGLVPSASFILTVSGPSGTDNHQVSLNQDSPDYLPLVLGTQAHDRTAKIFVEAVYADTLRSLTESGVVLRLSDVVPVSGHTDFRAPYQPAVTPWLVSQRQGNTTTRLLRFISIGDGDAANTQAKITIENIDLSAATFDVLIRAYYDTDDNQVVLERHSKLNLNPDSNQFILTRMGGRYDGNTQNEAPLNSAFYLVELNQNAPVGTVPCGFEGYSHFSGYEGGITPPVPVYKTRVTSVDKTGKFSFGISERAFDVTSRGRGLDSDLYQFSGVPVEGSFQQSAGFHLDLNASAILDANGNQLFLTGPATYALPVDEYDQDSPYYNKRNRRFTFVAAGGFDGWDIYRTERTNKDAFRTVAGSDYQAWLKGLSVLENPLDSPGEILITSGLNFSDHLSLVEVAFEIIEEIRKDCVYLVEAPDLGGEPGTTQDACDLFDSTGLQSSYGAWHYPWVQNANPDAGNGQVYVSPSGEQARCMALTDKQKAKWFAAAGQNRGSLPKVRQARRRLSDNERSAIHASRGNAIVTFPHGLIDIFGNNTMLPLETGSPLTSLNVRRALLYVRRELGAIAEGLILDQQSDDVAVQQFLSRATPVLERMKRERGLFAFEIAETSPDNPEAADRKRKYFRLALKPIEALENIGFIIEVGEGTISIAEGS
jgi:hypothetical protein